MVLAVDLHDDGLDGGVALDEDAWGGGVGCQSLFQREVVVEGGKRG